MRQIILLCLILLVGISYSSAQDSSTETWNWAWREATGELFAYSSSGVVNTLLEDGTESILGAWRLADDRAISLIQANGQIAFYDLTSQAVQPYTFNFDVRYSYHLEAYNAPYIVFTPTEPQSSPPYDSALLMNLETREIELLSDHVWWRGCCRFSQDGQYLRYVVASGDNESRTLMVCERVLASGEERVLHRFYGEDEYLFFYPDRYGERWLLLQQPFESNLYNYHLFFTDGTNEQIYQQSAMETYTYYQFLDDDLLAYQPLCMRDCELQLWTVEGNLLTFMLPSPLQGTLSLIKRLDDGSLFTAYSDRYLLLSATDEPQPIGFIYYPASHLPPNLSPDRRWLMVASTEFNPVSEIWIWDLMNQEKVLEILVDPEDAIYSMMYDAEGFIVHTRNEHRNILYRYEDRTVFNLTEDYGSFFDILPDGSVLSVSYSNQMPMGIYRYSPDDDNLVLLIADVERLQLEDVNYYDAYP